MQQPAVLFKKKSMKLCLFLKPKVKQKFINTVVCSLHKRKDVKKNVEKKIGESFLKLICFIFYFALPVACFLCFVRSSY